LDDVKGALDRLAGKGLIHKNKAANYKSKLEKHVNQL
jgi:small subunit ribosomal protein S20